MISRRDIPVGNRPFLCYSQAVGKVQSPHGGKICMNNEIKKKMDLR